MTKPYKLLLILVEIIRRRFSSRQFFILSVMLIMISSVLTSCDKAYPQIPYSPAKQQPSGSTNIPVPSSNVSFSYTYSRSDGNRLMAGHGWLPDYNQLDIRLTSIPVWILGSALDRNTIWVAVLNDGRVEGFLVKDGEVTPYVINPARLPEDMPPMLVVRQGNAELMVPPLASASKLTHPVILPSSGLLAFVDKNGDVVIWDKVEIARFSVNALPDSRIVTDEKDRLLVLSGATDRYGHGVLGDRLEASSVSIIEVGGTPKVIRTIETTGEDVIESIAPIWADITGNGTREIIVTLSNAKEGARVVAFNEEGKLVATGSAIGQGFRWRHQLVVGPFGPEGEIEFVDVVTPHIGGIVSFYQFKEGELHLVADLKGYTSHIIGSRNLDMAFAADLDGDKRIELLLPSQDLTELGVISRNPGGAEVERKIPVGGKLTTNLAAVTLTDGSLAVGVGREDEVLRLWLP